MWFNNSSSSLEVRFREFHNPWLSIPHEPQPGPIDVSNGEGALYPTTLDTQQPPQQQQQQRRRQLPFNSLPATATTTATTTATSAAGALTRKRTNSASSTSTTSVTYLRNAAAAFIATAHQNHFQFPHKVLHPEIQPLSTANLDLQYDVEGEDDDESFTSRELWSSLPRDVGAKVMGGGSDVCGGIEQEFMTEDDDDQLEDDRGRGFESTTPPLDLGQIVNSEEQFWRRRNRYDPSLFPSTTAATTVAAVDAFAIDDASEFVESADRASWVSELSSAGDRNQSNQQHQPYDHPMSLFSPKVGGNNESGSGGQAPTPWQDSRSEQDREVFEVCSRRVQRGYTPSQNIHKALISSIRSSFLASLNESQRASMMNGDSSSVQRSTSGDEDLKDFLQPWYQPRHLPRYASPDQEYSSGTFEKEAHQRREEELLEVIAQLEKDLQELHSSTVELQTRLHESEERNERMVVEHNCALQHVKEEYDHQIHDTKKRTKRFYDETVRKRQRDEDKRLEGLQEQLSQTLGANKDLRTTIRGLQRERLDAEQDQRDDLSVLSLFIENELSPMVSDLAGGIDGGGVIQLQAVGAFKCRRPSTINTVTTAIAKGNLYDHDLTPTTAVPHPVPIPLPTPSSQDNSSPKPSSTTTTTIRQCTSPRGQKCMSLLEQLQSALSIFANATAVTTPTTTIPHDTDKASSIPYPAGGGLQQEEPPKTPAPFRKTHSRHTSTATNPTTTATATTTKHGRHVALTKEHLVRIHETERLEDLKFRRVRKQYSDSSSASSGHTVVASALPPKPFRQVVVSTITGTPMTAAVTPPPPPPPPPATYPCVPSVSEKPPASVSISTPINATTTAVSSLQKHTPLTTTTTTSSPPTKTKTNNPVDTKEKDKEKKEMKKEKEKDRSLQQCLAEQHTRYQKEIERIKQQCINIYRQSLEDVRADMKFKLGQGGRGGVGQTRRARSTTAVAAVPVVATATAH
ncbi:hypothetical protein EC957_004791 [Mortierella hygrophila]|uniref:Uncharacterized protein n=1 Tax=Mortierella hygrophila TaxID=979708 RepID=A0A9P6FEL1_9FUNG|nr:hypothetical protein EC957_004791 [Mortierella hygrophila]